MTLKFFNASDIHLYDKNIGQSRLYPEQSIQIVDELYRIICEEDYDFCILGGDIQHEEIYNSRYDSYFMKMLNKINQKTKEKLIKSGKIDKLKIIDREGQEDNDSYLFVLEGNHDISKNVSFSFFNKMIENNIFRNPLEIHYEGLRIVFKNYTRNVEELKTEKIEGFKKVIGNYHNLILEKGIYVDDFIKDPICPYELGLFKNIDVAIINDIHAFIPPRDLITEDKKTTIYTTGSLGRTSFVKNQDRDFGYLTAFIYKEDERFEHGLVKFDLIPSEEFFKKGEAKKKRQEKNAFKDFSLSLEKVQLSYRDLKQEISEEPLDEDIKELCYSVIDLDPVETIIENERKLHENYV